MPRGETVKCPPLTDVMFPPPLDLLRAACAETEAHPAAVGMQFLVALGNIIGSTCYALVGETQHWTNEFALIVGATSTGRKGDAGHLALAPFEQVDAEWFDAIAGGLSTGEGLIYSVRDPVLNSKGKIIKKGVDDKRLLCVETEFSAVLKQFTRDSNILSNTLRQAWDGKMVLRTLTKESPLKATGAHISITGHATPEDLRHHVTDLDMANGVMNRFVCVASERPYLVPSPRPLSADVRSRLVEHVRSVVTHAQLHPGEVRRTKQAREMWDHLYRTTLARERPGLLGSLLARGPAHVTRLELLFSAMDCSTVRKRSHLAPALAWWDYIAASTAIIFSDRTGNDAADRIRSEMQVGDELTVSEIREQLFANKISSGRLRDALDLLQKLGEVKIRTLRTGGRPAVEVRRVAPPTEQEVVS